MNVTQEMIRRFLTWPVPADCYPDGTPGQPGRTGTNLLTATQAQAMLEHVLATNHGTAGIVAPAEGRELSYCEKGGNPTKDEDMRTIEDHKINPANDTLQIAVTDVPGAGGANHRYEVTGMDMSRNASQFTSDEEAAKLVILFQNGPIPQNGVNGITQEVLLAIVADRLRSFQAGPFACKANACALTHIEEAQHWLQQRTIERMRRGVEGTHTV